MQPDDFEQMNSNERNACILSSQIGQNDFDLTAPK